jgi:CTD small phosphatase-like protein 2
MRILEKDKLSMGQFFMRHVSLRPGTMKLLNELYKTYEIIVYTSLDQDFTKTLIKKKLDKKGVINTLLVKDYYGHYIKDLRILKNRDLSKIVLLDSSVISGCNQMDNSIVVPHYKSDKQDRVLYEVIKTLKTIRNKADVRTELRKMHSLSDMFKPYMK